MNDPTFPALEEISKPNEPSPALQSDEAAGRPDECFSTVTGADDLRRRHLLRRFWTSAKGFWGKDGYRSAWPLSGGMLLIIVLNLATLYGMNVWNRGIFDALDKRNSERVLELALIYFPLLVGSVFLGVLQVYARTSTQRRWRAWLSDHLVGRWLANGRYYQLNLVSGDHQNPEFRIADDVRAPPRLACEKASLFKQRQGPMQRRFGQFRGLH
jgi:ABC-type uncharacterized transport system fused permease/ATPase subunit